MEATCHPRQGVVNDKANSPVGFCSEQPAVAGEKPGALELTIKSLQFVLHIADDLAVEEVDDALSTGCVFL